MVRTLPPATVFRRWQSPIKALAWLAAGVSVCTACATQPSRHPDPPGQDPRSAESGPTPAAATPPSDPLTAAVPGGGRSPVAATDETPAAHRLSSSAAAGAIPTERAPFANRPESAMGSDLESSLPPSPPDPDASKSYVIPAIDIVGFEFLLNQFDRHVVDHNVYGSDTSSIKENLHSGWVIDKDPFSVNQFGHPYSGSMYHGFARSAGLNYWEALGYDFAGSALWEIAGETDPPSLNDQISTTFGGSFLGEALFRMANLVLGSGDGAPGLGRSVAAAVISPSSAFNRHAFGDRFKAVYPSHDPAVFWEVGLGARRNSTLNDPGVLSHIVHDEAVASFSMDYGLPGKSDYTYDRPFDYFHFEAAATSSPHAFPESIMVRGLLTGTDYSSGPDYRGIWGLYGTYDYFSPEIFKVSSTALSLGTTGQYLMSDRFALQGSCLGGAGWTAAGTNANQRTDRDYRYSVSPQGLLALRLVCSDVFMLDLEANDYLITGGSGSTPTSGSENIFRAQISLTVRVYDHHALGIQFVESRRSPSFSGVSNALQSVGAVTLFYTYLSDTAFGVVRR